MKIKRLNEKYAVDNMDVGEKKYDLYTVNNHNGIERCENTPHSLDECLQRYQDIKDHILHNYTPYIKETKILTDEEIDLLLSLKKYNL